MTASNIIYLDNAATTPLDPRVLEAMMPYLTNAYANAASNHSFGVEVNQAVKKAREHVANLIGSETTEIVFTSGATEAINLALKGLVEQYGHERNHIVTVVTEHPAVLDTCRYLETKGVEVSYLPVQADGLLDLKEVEEAVRPDTLAVCVMLVNNEIGVIQPIKEIAQLAHNNGAFMMTDATQAVCKIPINVNELGIDLMAFSAHKFYGPKGIGGLYVRSKRPYKVKLKTLLHGGGHERAMRSGTLNVPGIVGLGKAAEIASLEMENDKERVGELKRILEASLLSLPDTLINGNVNQRIYNITNLLFKRADADAIIAGLENIAVSNGSACSSTKVEPSHVLMALGITEQEAYSSIRFSLGRFVTKEEVLAAVNQIKLEVIEMRALI